MMAVIVRAESSPFASDQPTGSSSLSSQGCFSARKATSDATQRHLPVRRWRFFTPARSSSVTARTRFRRFLTPASFKYGRGTDRKSVVEGKSVSVRVGLGGRRINKKKNKKEMKIEVK